ncbi:hypothetical protein Tsubulata_008331, partial [Turnera subulata]
MERKKEKMGIRQVWGKNFKEELRMVHSALYKYNFLSVDTEFPGCLRRTPRLAGDDVRYADMKYNVDNTRLLQLGLTLSDDGNRGAFMSWEFNFAFDLGKESYNEDSVRFLKKNGIDFDKLRSDGINWDEFRQEFAALLPWHRNLTWVTFHGSYDLAYLLKLVTNNKPLPPALPDFTRDLPAILGGRIIDLKRSAQFFHQLKNGELGLEELGRLLQVERPAGGGAHNAGSDSLLTALVFHRMRCRRFPIVHGCLYGLSAPLATPPGRANLSAATHSTPTPTTTTVMPLPAPAVCHR